MRPERDPTLRLNPVAAKAHPIHGRLEVVVPDLSTRDTTQGLERGHMALEKRLLSLRRVTY